MRHWMARYEARHRCMYISRMSSCKYSYRVRKDTVMRTTTRLRELLAGPDLIVAPGAYDALSARLIAQAGFPVVYMTGFGTAASVLGQPDVGLLTMSEMVSRAAALAAVVGDVPLIADADTGYGNPINVRRTIHEY